MSKANATTKSKTKAIIPRRRPKQPNLFGPPLLLLGEDAAAYDELHARIRADVKPVDTVDEMFVADVVYLQWEVLRGRRLKCALLRWWQRDALEEFLPDELHYNQYVEECVDELVKILKANLPVDQAGGAKQLARAYAQSDPDAIDKVYAILDNSDLDLIEKIARMRKAGEFAQKYVQRESNAVTIVHMALAGANTNIDDLMANKICDMFDTIERIDRLITIAENRRNSSLHEIDRHRTALAKALRCTIQDVEDAEYQVIETRPTKGKH
jgi:hypothetical protein